jgi:3-(3-hydroxy-phenyl)propionate hydroxylase
MPRYAYAPFPYVTPPELRGKPGKRVPVLIVGAGPVGLAAAIDLALHKIPSIVVDDNYVVSVGSRAICWAKRTLEIFDRLGVGDRMVAKGVTWQVGRLFHRDKEVYAFDLLPESGHKMPAFINLQQYYVEQFLVERCADFPDLIDLRWKNKAVAIVQTTDGIELNLETLDGTYTLEADYLIACDGARSAVRSLMGLTFQGQTFEERFLITDIEMLADFPSERWFWFEPPFHTGQSALLHKQPDNIYRIDLQLGPDAHPGIEAQPERVIPRIKAMLGDRPFTIDWTSVYRFQCARLQRFVHDRVIFAGDSAHVVSPFGARGGNGGIQDVDNLAWKLAMVLQGDAKTALLETYNEERVYGADENIRNSSRATRFMSPAEGMERMFRDAVLDLASEMPFARKLVNSGRLSQPCSLAGLSSCRSSTKAGALRPGTPCPDAPHNGGWLLNQLGGRYKVLAVGANAPHFAIDTVLTTDPLAIQRYGDGISYVIRPDQHIHSVLADGVDPAHLAGLSVGKATT